MTKAAKRSTTRGRLAKAQRNLRNTASRSSFESKVLDLLMEIHERIGALERQGVVQMAKIADVKAKLVSLKADVESETTVVEAVKRLLEGQAAQLADLRQQLADAIAANDPAAIQAVLDQIDAVQATNKANADALAAAVIANTPATP